MDRILKLIDLVEAGKLADAGEIVKTEIASRVEARRAGIFKKFESLDSTQPLNESKLMCEAVQAKGPKELPVKIKDLMGALAKATDCDKFVSMLASCCGPCSPEGAQVKPECPFTPAMLEVADGCLKLFNDALFANPAWKAAIKAFDKSGYNVKSPAYYQFIYAYSDAISLVFNALKSVSIYVHSQINNNFSYLDALAKKYAK